MRPPASAQMHISSQSLKARLRPTPARWPAVVTGLSGTGFAMDVSASASGLVGASPLHDPNQVRELCIFGRLASMRHRSVLTPPFIPCGTVRAFVRRSRLGLAGAPPFGVGVPQQPRRRHGLQCPLLTSASRSENLAALSVP